MALNLFEVLGSERLNLASAIEEDKKAYEMKRSNGGKEHAIGESMSKKRSRDKTEDSTPYGSAKAHETRDGADRR